MERLSKLTYIEPRVAHMHHTTDVVMPLTAITLAWNQTLHTQEISHHAELVCKLFQSDCMQVAAPLPCMGPMA